jgi:hypothetical protein
VIIRSLAKWSGQIAKLDMVLSQRNVCHFDFGQEAVLFLEGKPFTKAQIAGFRENSNLPCAINMDEFNINIGPNFNRLLVRGEQPAHFVNIEKVLMGSHNEVSGKHTFDDCKQHRNDHKKKHHARG